MNNSKKLMRNGQRKNIKKVQKKVYSRSDRAITLIALIVTIIVLLILAGVTINLAVNNQGIFNKAKTATMAFKNASENEQTGLDEADKEIAKYMPKEGSEGGSGSESGGGNSGSVTTTGKGTILSSSSFPKISVSGLKYADLDGDETADGIIVADISKASTDKDTYKGGNPWGYSNGSFSYTKKETSELREYSENTYEYTNADGYKVDGTLIKCTNSTGTPRYYVLSLANYDANNHYFYKTSDYSTLTSEDFGKGKENTEKMIDTGTYEDMWNIIEDKVKEGWFVPSKEEWSAFASYLNISRTRTDPNCYVNYGLNNCYWSSSWGEPNFAWTVSFLGKNVNINTVHDALGLRLCATF